MVFLNPGVSSMKDWQVFWIGLNFLLNSSLAWCAGGTSHEKKCTVGGFQNMFFLNPLASKFKVWPVFFPETDFLFKSILTWCATIIAYNILLFYQCP